MTKYNVVVAGTVLGTYTDKAEAEQRLNEVRHSFLAMVHPWNCFYIKEEIK